ncbi:hypothetical protein B6D29_03290 [Microgenomates bacterium UTCPR1]|nr:MAG: hypothetical protein B6D29_03290 [Microgenomates bacterium UTCPR1]
MNNKTLVIILVIMTVITAFFSWQVMSDGGGITLSTDPNPLQPGPAIFNIEVKDKNGKSVDNATVSFDLNMTTMNMGVQQGSATAQGNGRYAAKGNMTMRGPWRVKVAVTMPDGNSENRDFIVNVP